MMLSIQRQESIQKDFERIGLENHGEISFRANYKRFVQPTVNVMGKTNSAIDARELNKIFDKGKNQNAQHGHNGTF